MPNRLLLRDRQVAVAEEGKMGNRTLVHRSNLNRPTVQALNTEEVGQKYWALEVHLLGVQIPLQHVQLFKI